MRQALDDVLLCKAPWGRILEDVRKNYAWDFEEATAMRINQNKDDFYKEVFQVIRQNYDISEEIINELIKYQKYAVIDPTKTYPAKHYLKYNFHEVIHKKAPFRKKRQLLEFEAKNFNGDYYAWGTEILWWGRRVAACKTKIKVVGHKRNSDIGYVKNAAPAQ